MIFFNSWIPREETKGGADPMGMVQKMHSSIGFREIIDSNGVINPSNHGITQKEGLREGFENDSDALNLADSSILITILDIDLARKETF